MTCCGRLGPHRPCTNWNRRTHQPKPSMTRLTHTRSQTLTTVRSPSTAWTNTGIYGCPPSMTASLVLHFMTATSWSVCSPPSRLDHRQHRQSPALQAHRIRPNPPRNAEAQPCTNWRDLTVSLHNQATRP